MNICIGTIKKTDDTAYALSEVRFRPFTPPVAQNTVVLSGHDTVATTDAVGDFSTILRPGHYFVFLLETRPFRITMPGADGTYRLEDLMDAGAGGGGGTIPSPMVGWFRKSRLVDAEAIPSATTNQVLVLTGITVFGDFFGVYSFVYGSATPAMGTPDYYVIAPSDNGGRWIRGL